MNPPIVAVFGSSSISHDDPDYAEGVRLGRALANAGFGVATGGYLGIMEAVSKGAREAGGEVIGITAPPVFPHRAGANQYVTREIATQTLPDRIHHLIDMAAGFVVLTASFGTLVELAVAWNVAVVTRFQEQKAKPIVAVGGQWAKLVSQLADQLDVDPSPVTSASTVDEAAEIIIQELR